MAFVKPRWLGRALWGDGRSKAGRPAFDLWTFVHLGAGAALGATGIGWFTAVALIVLYEGFEALLRRVKRNGAGVFEYESWPNIVVDVIAGLVGYALIAPWSPGFGFLRNVP